MSQWRPQGKSCVGEKSGPGEQRSKKKKRFIRFFIPDRSAWRVVVEVRLLGPGGKRRWNCQRTEVALVPYASTPAEELLTTFEGNNVLRTAELKCQLANHDSLAIARRVTVQCHITLYNAVTATCNCHHSSHNQHQFAVTQHAEYLWQPATLLLLLFFHERSAQLVVLQIA
jgi:hypothetical protein